MNTLARRLAIHCNRNNNSNSAITKAITKYGKRAFKLTPLEILEEDNRQNLFDKLNLLEKAYISSYNSLIPNGYNILSGGKNTPKPLAVREKISKSLKGNPKLKTWLGKNFTDDHKRKITESQVLSKPLICMETNEIFASIAEASRKLNIQRTALSLSLRKTGIFHNNNLTLRYLSR